MRTRTHRRCEHPILARTSASGHNAKDNMRISGNTFLVTGGGSGLGAACVRRLAAAGGNVVIADVTRDDAWIAMADADAAVLPERR